ncbi:MAG: glycosyltransferase family 4 protein [Acidimicrobiia bacterium]|nr:glycosyltransferase family 4 protein [Acidimicrobiia bacterium]MYC57717.1 glycosyltransferase family 4 protein [Acidimicrobiia bacterium]MYG94624.1 glycosyltransferase family 4 protein [Acidimicrobiia bacterium]MYI30916.1 glycosyltransferase family 4 protein [Acidimicrobiia bacterium]
MVSTDKPLKIALLSYRSKPHCGGQGVYVHHLSKALSDRGHRVQVLSGQPYPVLDKRVKLQRLPSLDIFNDAFPGRTPGYWEVKTWADSIEVCSFMTGTFSEPLAFSLRAWQALRNHLSNFDIVHDNQSLGYGLLGIQRQGLPVLSTIHHPITIDAKLELEQTTGFMERFGKRRWYSFTKMQARVARRLKRIITVSESSRNDIASELKVPLHLMHVVPVGVDPNLFRPLPNIQRCAKQIITTASADVAMKGLRYLLEALAKLRTERDISLLVIGKPREDGASIKAIEHLGLNDAVKFVTNVTDERIVELYAQSAAAVVPSLYEGFSLPAIEAMCTTTPLVATTGGALPEVAGTNGETCITVPPGDAEALTAALRQVLDNPEFASRIGTAGRERVLERWSWHHTAAKTEQQYLEMLIQRQASNSSR